VFFFNSIYWANATYNFDESDEITIQFENNVWRRFVCSKVIFYGVKLPLAAQENDGVNDQILQKEKS